MFPVSLRIRTSTTAVLIFSTVLVALTIFGCQSADAETRVNQLLDKLAEPELEDWKHVENEIWRLWSQSGSAATDLLLQRGVQAMQRGDFRTAVSHLTTVVDHAPGFAEGLNKRATAFFLMKKYSLSIADIEQTLKLEPRHFGAISGLAMIFEILGHDELALDVYQHLIVIHPHLPGTRNAVTRLQQRISGSAL